MQILKEIEFFKDIDDKTLQDLWQICTLKNYSKDEIVFYETENSKHLHILIKGKLQIYKTNAKAQEIILHEFSPINFVAELANFEDIPYPATAKFTSNGQILKINYASFKKDFLSNPQISFSIIKSLSQKLKIISSVLHQETILQAKQKVAKMLVLENTSFKTLKNNQIAKRLNISPETLSRILTKFKQDNLINQDLEILNKTVLQKIYD